jgi:hypothetical protein
LLYFDNPKLPGHAQRVRNIYNQRGRGNANPVIITFIDAEILAQGPWLPLFAPDEHQAYHVPLLKEGCSYGSPAWYRDEILIIREIPQKAIIDNAVAPDPDSNPDWTAFETIWKEKLANRLGPSALVNTANPFIEEYVSFWNS